MSNGVPELVLLHRNLSQDPTRFSDDLRSHRRSQENQGSLHAVHHSGIEPINARDLFDPRAHAVSAITSALQCTCHLVLGKRLLESSYGQLQLLAHKTIYSDRMCLCVMMLDRAMVSIVGLLLGTRKEAG